MRTIPHHALDSNANAEYQLCNRRACSKRGRMYLIDMSRAHGAGGEMMEVIMNNDLEILGDYAQDISIVFQKLAAEKDSAGLFATAAMFYDIAAAAARIVAARHGDDTPLGGRFMDVASQCEADAKYCREKSRLNTWPVA